MAIANQIYRPSELWKRGARPASTWASFEKTILLPSPLVTLRKMGAEAVHIPGGKIVTKRGPCDFWGAVNGTGRAIVLDAKECDSRTRFPIGNKTHFPDHQRAELIAMGEAGAVSGLLVHATTFGCQMYLWLSWRHMRTNEPSIAWIDTRWMHATMIGTGVVDWEEVTGT